MLNMPCIVRRAFLILMLTLPASLLPAQGADPTIGAQSSTHKQIFYPFELTDRINGYIEPINSRYYVGQPIEVPIVLVNHSQFPIHLETGFNPRAQLKVMIRPENEQQYQYVGPYMPGFYGPSPIPMYPFDEYHSRIVIWSDLQQPGHLALPKPGRYTITITIQFKVDELKGGTFREMPLAGGVFSVEVDPTPKPVEPLVELLKKEMNVVYLHLHKVPDGWDDKKVKDLLAQYPLTVFAPYLNYALASYYVALYDLKPTKEFSDQALYYYRMTVLSKTAFQMEAYIDFLDFLDRKLQLTLVAETIAREFVAHLPPDRLGRDGNKELFLKYLVNTKELDPGEYWAFLP